MYQTPPNKLLKPTPYRIAVAGGLGWPKQVFAFDILRCPSGRLSLAFGNRDEEAMTDERPVESRFQEYTWAEGPASSE